jgi:RNA polymerase sigma-70 factor (ECF subfamily)
MSSITAPNSPEGKFEETHWSLVLKAGERGEGSADALDKLCRSYWMPLYTYARRRGFAPAEAEDVTQGFFHDLIARQAFEMVDRSKGRFRSFLLGSLKNFLANEWDRQRTLKRGGHLTFVSLDEPQAETLFAELIESQLLPEQVFDRVWALSILHRVMARLRQEYQAEGRQTTFEALESILSKDGRSTSYADLAQRLSISEAGVRMAVMRLRRRFGELLRRETAKTVTSPGEADDELKHLLSCL